MFNSSVLEVAIGLTFCYATLALIVSTVQEALASALHLRAHTLLDGIKTMLNDPRFNGMARALYSHALINPHDDGQLSDHYEPDALEATRAREQGLGVGARELNLQRDPHGRDSAEAGQGEDDGVIEVLRPGDPDFE